MAPRKRPAKGSPVTDLEQKGSSGVEKEEGRSEQARKEQEEELEEGDSPSQKMAISG